MSKPSPGVWSTAPKIPKNAEVKKKAGNGRLFTKRPPQSSLVEAFWMAELYKLGSKVFAEQTVCGVWSLIEMPEPNEGELLFYHFLEEMEMEDAPEEFWNIVNDERAKKVHIDMANDVLKKIRDMREGDKFGVNDEQIFRGQWFIGINHRLNARDTVDHAFSLLKQGRRDYEKMAEEIWAKLASNMSKGERAFMDDLNNITRNSKEMTFEEVIRWGFIKRAYTVFENLGLD